MLLIVDSRLDWLIAPTVQPGTEPVHATGTFRYGHQREKKWPTTSPRCWVLIGLPAIRSLALTCGSDTALASNLGAGPNWANATAGSTSSAANRNARTAGTRTSDLSLIRE